MPEMCQESAPEGEVVKRKAREAARAPDGLCKDGAGDMNGAAGCGGWSRSTEEAEGGHAEMFGGLAATRRFCSSARCWAEKSPESPETVATLERVVYMAQLPYDVTKEQLGEAFARYGPIEEIHLPMTKGREHVKGYGRMVFADKQNARRAAVQMQSYVINDRPIRLTLGPDLKKKQATKYDVVMLKNLSYEAEEEELMKALRPYQALRVGLARSPIKNECLGYGYVRFASSDAAERAIEALNRTTLCGRKVRMHLAEPKDHHYRFIV